MALVEAAICPFFKQEQQTVLCIPHGLCLPMLRLILRGNSPYVSIRLEGQTPE